MFVELGDNALPDEIVAEIRKIAFDINGQPLGSLRDCTDDVLIGQMVARVRARLQGSPAAKIPPAEPESISAPFSEAADQSSAA